MSNLKNQDPEIYQSIIDETKRQEYGLELIASENFVSEAVLEAQGSVMTNKYAEGYPGKRYYGGCEFVDVAENIARDRAKQLFGCEYANVQPHSGSTANQAVYFTYCQPGDTVLGMDLAHGGHLTHGSPVSFSGKMYKIVSYGVKRETGYIDMDDVARKAREHKPKMIIVGASAYSRHYEFAKFREIADEVGAFLFADVAHPAGLIAAGLHPSPIPHCHVVTTTTHKTLRGPRGGMVLIGKDSENPFGHKIKIKAGERLKMMSEVMDSTVMPGIQGGPLMHVIAAKAVAFKEALDPSFKIYAQQVIDNARALAQSMVERGYQIVSGGTDNHVMLIDLTQQEHHRQGGRERPARGRDHGQQEHGAVRRPQPLRDLRLPDGHRRFDHPGDEAARDEGRGRDDRQGAVPPRRRKNNSGSYRRDQGTMPGVSAIPQPFERIDQHG